MRSVCVSLVTAGVLLFHASVLVQAAGADRARGAGSAAGSGHRVQSIASNPDRGMATSSRTQPRASNPDRGVATSSHRVQSNPDRGVATSSHRVQARGPRPDASKTPTSHRATLPADVAQPATVPDKATPTFPGIDGPTRPMPVELQGLARGRGGATDYSAYIQHGSFYWQLAHTLAWSDSLGPHRRVYTSVVSWPGWDPLSVASSGYDEDLSICTEVEPPVSIE